MTDMDLVRQKTRENLTKEPGPLGKVIQYSIGVGFKVFITLTGACILFATVWNPY